MERASICQHRCYILQVMSGKSLQDMRKKSRVSQKTVAQKIGYSVRHYRRMEQGKCSISLEIANDILSSIFPKEGI
jgi:DNA-binding XRE family transcriptional regulator